jgi:hypothetical protein
MTAMVSQVVHALSTAAPLLADETDAVLAKLPARLIEAVGNDAKLGRAQKISRHRKQEFAEASTDHLVEPPYQFLASGHSAGSVPDRALCRPG